MAPSGPDPWLSPQTRPAEWTGDVSKKPLYVVAEIKNDGRLVIGAWTYEVFTDPREALAELADAHDAGLTGHQI